MLKMLHFYAIKCHNLNHFLDLYLILQFENDLIVLYTFLKFILNINQN